MFFVLVIYIIILKNENNLCQNVEITLGASGCASGYGHSVWSVGGGFTFYIIMKEPYSSCICAFFGSSIPTFRSIFFNYFILVFVTLLYLSNFIREKISMEQAGHYGCFFL